MDESSFFERLNKIRMDHPESVKFIVYGDKKDFITIYNNEMGVITSCPMPLKNRADILKFI